MNKYHISIPATYHFWVEADNREEAEYLALQYVDPVVQTKLPDQSRFGGYYYVSENINCKIQRKTSA